MSTIPYPPQRPLSVGETLDLAFRIYRATLAKCLVFSGLAVLAAQIPNLYNLLRGRGLIGVASGAPNLMMQLRDPALWLAYVVGVALQLAFLSAVLLRQRRLLIESSSGGELSAALGRLPALLGLAILVGLSCVACFVPAFATAGAARGLLGLLGLLALSYLLVSVLCAQTVLLTEGLGPAASYVRSWRLSRGSFWRLSLIYTIAIVVLMAVYVTIGIIGGAAAAVIGRGDVAVVTAAGALVIVAVGAVITPFFSALSLAVLGDLKVRKEGADLEQRISATA